MSYTEFMNYFEANPHIILERYECFVLFHLQCCLLRW
jgi:hypothetical protein